MFNKKMLLSVFVIGLVSVLAGSTTWAYYQDTEISEDNNLSSGTLDLNLTNAPFTVGNIEPGDSDTVNQTIKNLGSLEGELDIAINNVANIESTGNTSYENDSINGIGVGELGSFVSMAIWIDIYGDSDTFDSGYDISLVNITDYTDTAAKHFSPISSYEGISWDNVITMTPSAEYNFVVEWNFPLGSEANNTAQGDSVNFDVTFILEQAEVDS